MWNNDLNQLSDFIILHHNKNLLEFYKKEINTFLKSYLKLELHPDKSKILTLKQGVNFLGFRIFYYHKLLKKSNLRKFFRKILQYEEMYQNELIDYGTIYDSLEGWIAYAKQADTYKLRKTILKEIEQRYPKNVPTKEINRCLKTLI